MHAHLVAYVTMRNIPDDDSNLQKPSDLHDDTVGSIVHTGIWH